MRVPPNEVCSSRLENLGACQGFGIQLRHSQSIRTTAECMPSEHSLLAHRIGRPIILHKCSRRRLRRLHSATIHQSKSVGATIENEAGTTAEYRRNGMNVVVMDLTQ